MKTKQSKPRVKLVGKDGNAYSIMGNCHAAWRKAGRDEAEWDKIFDEMRSGDYNHLLATAMKYFEVS